MEMLIIQWSKRGSGKIVISTLIMFSLLWWPCLQYPLLKAGQREWILHVFTALLRQLLFPEQFSIIYQAFLGNKAVLSDSLKTYWWRNGKKPTILLNLCTFPVFLHSPLSIKGKLFLYYLIPNLSATFAIMSCSSALMEVILLDVYSLMPFK